MKPNPSKLIGTCLTTALILPALAIEGPADNSPPPAADNARANHAVAIDTPAVKNQRAFLGVVSSDISDALAEHLNLSQEEGIIVRALQPDGPAEKAGIAVNDIITRVAGHLIGSTADLTKEIQSHKPGENVQLNYVHKGKALETNVNLGTRPATVAKLDPQHLEHLDFDELPKEFADRLRGAIEGNLGDLKLDIDDAQAQLEPEFKEAMREMRLRIQQAMHGLDDPEIPGQHDIEVHNQATIRLMDNEGSIELKSIDGGKEITVRDKQDKLTWTGPWDTEQDMAAAPEEVRERVERFNFDNDFKGPGIRLKAAPAPEPMND
jgi:serine protease Do